MEAPDQRAQLSVLVAVLKLLWHVSEADEEDADVKCAVRDRLASMPGGDGVGDGVSSSTPLLWPELSVRFWRQVEGLLMDGSGLSVKDDAFVAWLLSVLSNRPALPSRLL